MLGNLNPSTIATKIYDIMDDYEIAIDVFDYGAVDAVVDYLTNHIHVEYNLACSDWPNEEGGVCAIAFIDAGHPQLVMFDYEY